MVKSQKKWTWLALIIFFNGLICGLVITTVIAWTWDIWSQYWFLLAMIGELFILICSLALAIFLLTPSKEDKKLTIKNYIKEDYEQKLSDDEKEFYKLKNQFQNHIIFGKDNFLQKTWVKNKLIEMNDELFMKLVKKFKVQNKNQASKTQLVDKIMQLAF